MVDTGLLESSTAATADNHIVDPWKNHIFGLEMPVDIISIVYASTVALGGVIGFATKGSIPSLIAGLSFGAVLGFGAYLTSVNPRNYWVLFGTSAILGGMMGYRFYNSGKFMPAGLIFTLATLMIIRFSLRFIFDKNLI